jgi:hypothetical protein
MATSPNSISLPENRADLEALIEDFIARRDELESCPDLEDGGDHEPWISAQGPGADGQGCWGHGARDDREWDTAVAKPSPWSVERGPGSSQAGWAVSRDDECEEEARCRIAPRGARDGTQSPGLRAIERGAL